MITDCRQHPTARIAPRVPCFVVLAACALSAHATGVRTINTYTCRPDRTTTAADIVFRPGGIKNDTATMQYVACPVTRDQEGPYGFTFSPGNVVVSYYNESSAGSASAACIGYETDRALGVTKTFMYEGASGAPPGGWDSAVSYTGDRFETPPVIEGQLSIRCSISAGALLYKIEMRESGQTEE